MPDRASPQPPSSEPERLSPNALERRVKRWLLTGPFECYVQVTPGLESLLVEELLAGGFATSADELQLERGGVRLELDHEGVMRANLTLRTASRVLLRLGTFPAASPEMLYDRVRKLPWETQLGFAGDYQLRITARASNLQAGGAIANPVSSAISRRMRELDLYPKPADDAPLEFHVRLLNDYCTLSLNTSGEHLHRRGVRRHVHTAPLRETVAAAMVMKGLSGLDGTPDLILDPFCGSATLLIEAHDQLLGLAPGRQRQFAFEQAAWFRPGAWRQVVRDSEAATLERTSPPLIGIDNDDNALAAAKLNMVNQPATELRAEDSTRVDFDSFHAERPLLVTNLPYGVRLGEQRDALNLTRLFLKHLAGSRRRWRVVLLASPAQLAVIEELMTVEEGLRTKNGGLDVVMVVGWAGGSVTG